MKPSDDKRQFRFKKLLTYGWKAKKPLIAGFLVTFSAVATDLIGPYIIGMILDTELIEGIGAREPKEYALYLSLFILSVIGAGLLRYFSSYFFNQTANLVAKDIQEEVFYHVQELPIAFFDKMPAGKIVSRVTNDTRDVKVLFQVVLAQLTTAAVYGLGVYIGLIFIDPKLALLGLVPLPLVALVFVDFKNKSATYNYKFRKYLSDLNANLNENIQGMEIIQSYRQEETIQEEFKEINHKVYEQGVNMSRLYSYSAFNAISKIQYLTLAGALLYFGFGQITGAYPVTIGLLYIFVDYMTKIFNQVTNAIQRVGELERARGAWNHICELLEEETVDAGGEKLESVTGEVSFDRVNFSYLAGEPVLKEVSFQASAGQTIAFVGHTGSGKSTIMNLLFGFYKPDSGVIQIDGHDAAGLQPNSMRKEMSIVLQDPFLFHGDILSNITLFDESISEDMAREALIDVGGERLLNNSEKDMKTPVREGGEGFSAGERQLLSFARALVKNPKILVLDEATSNIDSETEQIIQKGIETLQRGRTTFIIAHRLSTIKNADQIFLMEEGRIVESGTHECLLQINGRYKEMYLSQSGRVLV